MRLRAHLRDLELAVVVEPRHRRDAVREPVLHQAGDRRLDDVVQVGRMQLRLPLGSLGRLLQDALERFPPLLDLADEVVVEPLGVLDETERLLCGVVSSPGLATRRPRTKFMAGDDPSAAC
jgi:hypothetical protein